ncbi:MAG: Bax inhibitor-1 family protein, partial [Deltaproteobacteria bacterium]
MTTSLEATGYPVAQAEPEARAMFIRKTYAHLAGAIAGFVVLEVYLVNSALAPAMLNFISSSSYAWLAILGAFIIVGWMASSLAQSTASTGVQYLGLALYVVAEGIIFLPLLYLAAYYAGPSVLPTAAILTGFMFVGLTAVAFTTRKDFSFLGGALTVGFLIALGLIVCSVIFGFQLGLIFSVVMVGLASAAILYDTSNVIHRFSSDQYVAASLRLFASVALLFWYVLRIVM